MIDSRFIAAEAAAQCEGCDWSANAPDEFSVLDLNAACRAHVRQTQHTVVIGKTVARRMFLLEEKG